MKTILLFLLSLAVASPLAAFDWPGGTMTVTAICTGKVEFEGMTPGSPWGTVPFLNNPVVQLLDATNAIVAQATLNGGAADWNDGGTRTGVVTFTMPAGKYTLSGQRGRRLQLIPGDGWMGWSLNFGAIPDPAGANVAPTIAWTATPGSVASGAPYGVSAHAHDADGNLSQVNVWKNGVLLVAAGGGTGTDGDASASSSDTGPATITYTAQAFDAFGASSGIITQTVTVNSPPPVMFTLVATADAGGSVSGGGKFANGTWASVSAAADALHDFAGWSGDAGGVAVPVGVLMNADKAVHAAFAPKLFALVTTAGPGGSVSPGGSYAYGASVSVTATADATHYFSNWSGDATGTDPNLALLITGPTSVQANFSPKLAQAISFPAPGDRTAGLPPFLPGATASSGLPVDYIVVSGPATIVGGKVSVTGPGPIVIAANQPGNGLYLPATAVTQAFNGVVPAVVKVVPSGRVKLGTRATKSGEFLVQVP